MSPADQSFASTAAQELAGSRGAAAPMDLNTFPFHLLLVGVGDREVSLLESGGENKDLLCEVLRPYLTEGGSSICVMVCICLA